MHFSNSGSIFKKVQSIPEPHVIKSQLCAHRDETTANTPPKCSPPLPLPPKELPALLVLVLPSNCILSCEGVMGHREEHKKGRLLEEWKGGGGDEGWEVRGGEVIRQGSFVLYFVRANTTRHLP